MDIRLIEERSLNALPSLYTLCCDGWLLRFAKGYTRRANSVNPLYSGTLPLDEKIAHCEEMYRAHGLSVVFKLTDAAHPPSLDAELQARGYQWQAGTIVQTLTLTGSTFTYDDDVTTESHLTTTWFQSFAQLNQLHSDAAGTLRQMLSQIQPKARYAVLVQDGLAVATGLAVLERGWVGLFDVVTHVDHRRRGFSSRLVGHLLAWARDNGAQQAYLQVVAENHPAVWMYNKLGFKETYHYWYRLKA
jgi:GNAT superfamily N-acetyltransferase